MISLSGLANRKIDSISGAKERNVVGEEMKESCEAYTNMHAMYRN